MNLVLFATPSLTPIFLGRGIYNFDNWIKEKSSAKAWNTSTVTTKGMLFSQNPTDIINYVKQTLNPNVNNYEDNQSNKESIEKITITRNNVKHLLKDNEKERSNYINRFIRTLQNPNLVIKSIENNKIYNYYKKSFSGENNKISGHVQIIKKCSDGNFYVTNHHLTNGKITKVLKNGQIIYDLSDLSAVQNAPDTNSITDVYTDFNPDINILYQSAYH